MSNNFKKSAIMLRANAKRPKEEQRIEPWDELEPMRREASTPGRIYPVLESDDDEPIDVR
jgi:hypothetical protein